MNPIQPQTPSLKFKTTMPQTLLPQVDVAKDSVLFSGKAKKEHSPTFPTRGKVVGSTIGLTAAAGAATVLTGGAALPLIALAATGSTAGVAVYDGFIQKKHTLRRNFPIFARARYILEKFRPEIQQYFIQGDLDEVPISIEKWKKVIQMSKEDAYKQGFGSLHDMYQRGFSITPHTMYPLNWEKLDEPRLKLGNSACKQPYDMSIFNISAMSYGSLSAEAVSAMNRGARLGNFAQNTGEGGISDFHLNPIGIENNYPEVQMNKVKSRWNKVFNKEGSKKVEFPNAQIGGDIIWQVGTGYFGARTPDGFMDMDKFEQQSKQPSVKAIELKLSQGAKPGLGGILPASKNTELIAKARGIEPWTEVRSPEGHSMFDSPKELLQLIKTMKEKSGGKPVGFKLCVGQRHEFLALCKAMVALNDPLYLPDFISVDGAEGGTGAAPIEFSNHVGLPLTDGLLFVHNALTGFNLRDDIKLIASGKIVDGYDIYEKLAIGADAANSARGMMIATGCIQARECHNNTCPTGIATQDERLTKGLDVDDKAKRVNNYHQHVMERLQQIMAATGVEKPEDISPDHAEYRVLNESNNIEMSTPLSEVFEYIPEGSLLEEATVPDSFKKAWAKADPNSSFAKASPIKGVPVQIAKKPKH